MGKNVRRVGQTVAAVALAAALAAPLAAQAPAPAPSPAAPSPAATAAPAPAPSPAPSATSPVIMPLPLPEEEPLPAWSLANAQALYAAIQGIDAEGLIPADYEPATLLAAIQGGEGQALNDQASKLLGWLIEDMRDGRTPMAARLQWFAVDPDQDINPTATMVRKALETNDVAGVLASLAPTHANYAALKAALAETPRASTTRRAAIRANMDRWRWLPRDLGSIYLIANVPEFQLRLMSGERIIRSYRTIVGKPGKTATPQLAEQVRNVVFNPTWTVPQSIVVGEGLGAKLLGRANAVNRGGYVATRGPDGVITVVQQPGPNNSLGLVKIDMPNEHAIYLHDTPNRGLFNATVRAFSHGCVRTEDAMRLAITMSILGAGISPEQAVEYSQSGKYTKVPMTRTFPVYISYFTVGVDVNGQVASFNDIYGRDAPVIASFAAPRQPHTSQRKSDEAVITLDNPL